jgi:ABC-2 type transport system ATP-binding protein
MEEADRLCDRLALLNEGRIVAEGTPAELKAQVADSLGLPATMHSVFMTYTGRSLDDDVEEDEPEPDSDG